MEWYPANMHFCEHSKAAQDLFKAQLSTPAKHVTGMGSIASHKELCARWISSDSGRSVHIEAESGKGDWRYVVDLDPGKVKGKGDREYFVGVDAKKGSKKEEEEEEMEKDDEEEREEEQVKEQKKKWKEEWKWKQDGVGKEKEKEKEKEKGKWKWKWKGEREEREGKIEAGKRMETQLEADMDSEDRMF
jgi:hypothetical protein